MRDDKENIIVELTFKFAISIVNFCEKLELQRKFVISNQVLKSGTSIGQTLEKHKMQNLKII